MALISSLTQFAPIQNKSQITTGLFNLQFQALMDDVNTLNAQASGSTAPTVLGYSTNTIQPQSGNTVLISGNLSTNTLAPQSGNTITALSGLSLIGPLSCGTTFLATGTAPAPSLAFSSETSLGLYRSAASILAASYGTFAPSGLSAVGVASVMTLTSSTATVTVNAAISTNSLIAQSGNTIEVYSQTSFANVIVTGVATPSAVSDVPSKFYVDQLTSGAVASFKGSFWTGVSAVTLSNRSLAYVTSTSSLSMVDSTNSMKCPISNIFVVLGTSNQSSVCTLAWPDAVVGGYTSLTTGAIYYAGTAGNPTITVPSAQSTIVMAVGVALSAATLLFNVTYIGSNAT